MNCCSSFNKPYQTFPCLTVPKFHALFCRISKIQIPGLRFPIWKHNTRDISHKMKIIHVQHQSKEVNKPVCFKMHQTSNINYLWHFHPWELLATPKDTFLAANVVTTSQRKHWLPLPVIHAFATNQAIQG